MQACQISTESYQIARIHIEEISLLTAAAFQKVSSTVILFQVKVGFGQCKCIQVLCIFLCLEKTMNKKTLIIIIKSTSLLQTKTKSLISLKTKGLS